jgi:hypothetical protein
VIARDVFQPGQTVVRRYFRGTHLTWAQATRVIADDGRGLLLWLPEGADFACRVDSDGQLLRAAPSVEAYGAAHLAMRSWMGSSALLLHPPGAAHSVWWFFYGRSFANWYVNLESPLVRRADGVDIVDHHLDIVVDSDRTWRWKDEEDFIESTGKPGFWNVEQAQEIRDEASRAVAAIEAGHFPYDGTWCDFEPGVWSQPKLPTTIDDLVDGTASSA